MFAVSLFLKDWLIRQTDCICATAGASVQVCERALQHNEASLTSQTDCREGEELVKPVPISPGAPRFHQKMKGCSHLRRGVVVVVGGAGNHSASADWRGQRADCVQSERYVNIDNNPKCSCDLP